MSYRLLARALVACALWPVPASAQTATLAGRITADRQPLAAEVAVLGTGLITRTDAEGRYTLNGVPLQGTLAVRAAGFAERRVPFSLRAGERRAFDVQLVPPRVDLAPIVVSATRESDPVAETPVAVSTVSADAIARTRAAHPSEIMNQVAGAYVNVTGGEGHMTAIRQPVTTDPVYLFLEDGIPTRSTGFFNHNALYEVNLPQAGGIEVLKGPGTALYGSDAIGGIVNVSTRGPTDRPTGGLLVEGGAFGFVRGLATASGTFGGNGLRADLNVTRTDGWRDGTAYDRQSATLRWDRPVAGGHLKTVIAGSRIDQQTAGTSAISETDYRDNPTANYTPVSYRYVEALRVSAAWEARAGATLVSFTPYGRYNRMDILPNWSLTFDPAIWETSNASVGMLARVRHDLAPWRTRVVAGVDVELSPGAHAERAIVPSQTAGVFTDFADGAPIYDYDVSFRQASPYLHLETSPVRPLRLTLGARLDAFGYTYDNLLDDVATGPHRRPADTSLTYTHLSPKVGATWAFAPEAGLFVSWRHGFRAPSEGQVFRQGSAVNTVGLAPVKVNSYEAGLRGTLGGRVRYDLAAYTMTKTDDILTFVRTDGVRETVNAGETSHRGVELGLAVALPADLTVGLAASYAQHRYEDWQPNTTTDYSGNAIESAPRVIASGRVSYTGAWLGGGDVGVEVSRVGGYWMDQANTAEYAGHTLINVRASYGIAGRVTAFARVMNLADTRYAERASFTTFRGSEFAPGLPRTLFAGLEYR